MKLVEFVGLGLIALVAMTAVGVAADGTLADGWAQATMALAYAAGGLRGQRRRSG